MSGALSLLLAAPAFGQASSDAARPESVSAFRPNVRPTLQVSRAPGAIVLDGRLDDAGWAGAAHAGNFSENWPREQAQPAVRSDVWVTYDDDHLYIAFMAHDDPSKIRASLRDRDQMWQDDYFGILLDTYGDAAWAYFLFANPLGVQGDSRFATSGGEDDGFDIVFETEAMVTDSGYQIEMAIPFESLRFPDRDVQTWRATFWRTRPRGSREQHTWAAMSRAESCFLCQFGTLAGIEGVRPGGALELLPSAVATRAESRTDAAGGWSGGDIAGDIGINARYAFPNGITAEATVNPDFSQVESDAGQVNVNSTFALFFSERRPFFQEGSDVFGSNFDVVYTRQINNPLAAVKLIGRMGRTTVAYLGARDEDSPLLLPFQERSYVSATGPSVSNVVRVRQTYLRDSYTGLMFTDRRLDGGGSGSVGGVDGVLRLAGNYRLEYQVLGSHSVEPRDTSLTSGINGVTFDGGRHTAAYDGESFTGYAQYTSFERSGRHWDFDFDYWTASPTFRADNGFETRNDYRRVTMFQGLQAYPGTSVVDAVGARLFARRDWTYDGTVKQTVIEPNISADLKRQTSVQVWYTFFSERFADVQFDGLRRWGAWMNSNFSDPVRIGAFVSHGDGILRNRAAPRPGRGTDLEVWGTLKPVSRLVIEPSVVYSTMSDAETDVEFFGGFILRSRFHLQFTRELFLRTVVQYDDFDRSLSVEPLLTYKANPFTLFYIGSSLAYDDRTSRGMTGTSRQLFTKLQYLIRW